MPRLILLFVLATGCRQILGIEDLERTPTDGATSDGAGTSGDGGSADAALDGPDPCEGIADGEPCPGGGGLCRNETCDPDDCYIGGLWHMDGDANGECQLCDVTLDRLGWTRLDSTTGSVNCSGGKCWQGTCCTGCWTGSSCEAGTLNNQCGANGGYCDACSGGTPVCNCYRVCTATGC